jgi:succinoglycan biosynthesis transport protein ExoP
MMEESSINWLQHLETIWRRRKTVLTIGLAGSLAVAGWIWFTPPLYRAHATILLGAQRVSTPRSDAMPDKAIDSEMALLASPALVKEVLQDLGVVPQPAAAAATAAGPAAAPAPSRVPATPARLPVEAPSNPVATIYRRAHGLPPPDVYDQQVRAVARGVETSRVDETNVIDVAYRGKDPRWAANFVNTLLAKHVERIARLNEQPDTRHFYQSQRELVFRRLQAAREALNRFREKQGSDLAPGDDAELHKSLTTLDGEHATAQSQLAEAQARVSYLRQEIGRHPPKIASESEMRQSEGVRLLEGRLAQLEMQRSEAITKYTPTSTPVHDLDAQIAETRKLMAGREMEHLGSKTAVNPTHQALELELVQRQAEAAALAARVRALSGEQGRLRSQISHLASVSPDLERLQNDEKSANDSYLDYMKKGEEARLTTALDQSGLVNISILERAEVPDSPEPAKAGFKLLAGIGASFLLGALLALVLERLDPVVNSGTQAERITGVPVIESVSITS